MIGVNKRLNSANTNEIKVNKTPPKSRDGKSRNVGHDTDVAVEMMDDSFTCSMASQALAMATRTLGNTKTEYKSMVTKSNAVDARKVYAEANETGLNDSLTFSMIAKVLDSEPQENVEPEIDGKYKSTADSRNAKGDGESSKAGKTSPDFSQDTIDIVNQICGDTPGRKTKPAPRKNNKRKNNCDSKDVISPPKRKRTPKGKKNISHEECDDSNSRNESTASDYVPPTPPDPNRTVSTRTPNRSSLRNRTESPAVRKPQKESAKELKSPKSSKPLNHPIKSENQEAEETKSLYEPSIPLTCQSFTIIDTAANKMLFEHFVEEWRKQEIYSLSIACEKIPLPPSNIGRIGANFNKGLKLNFFFDHSIIYSENFKTYFLRDEYVTGSTDDANDVNTDVDGIVVEGTSIRIVGLAVSWANRDSYYIALTKTNVQGKKYLNLTEFLQKSR